MNPVRPFAKKQQNIFVRFVEIKFVTMLRNVFNKLEV